MSAERETIIQSILTALEDIERGVTVGNGAGEHTYSYSPSQKGVVPIDDFGETLLNAGKEMMYFVTEGIETDTPDSAYTWLAEFEVFVLAFRRYEPSTNDPFKLKGERRGSIQNKIIDDMRAALSPLAEGTAVIDNFDFADWNVDVGEFRKYAYVELRAVVHFEWSKPAS